MSNFEMDYILSVGMSNLSEIKKAFNILSNKGKNSVNILHCISAYPTKENEANLNCIDILKKKFDCLVGQSDHTNDIFVCINTNNTMELTIRFTQLKRNLGFYCQ